MGNPVRGVRPPTSFSATNAQMWNYRKQSKVECKRLLTTVTKDGSRSSVQSLEVSYRPHLAVS